MLFDTHTHLNDEYMTAEERSQLAAEIAESDLAYIIDAGASLENSRQAIQDAEDYDWCYATVGIHPEYARSTTDADLEVIRQLAAHPKAVSIGECGLDFHEGKEDEAEQIELFRKQIRLANELKMPLMIHSRDASQLTMDILKEEGAFSQERKSWFPKRKGPNGEFCDDARVQIHCFSGSPELAEEYIKLGATISIGGPITFKNGKKVVEVFKQIPIEFVMSETDAPYMAPEPYRGRPNKPYYVEHVVRRMSILKDLSYEETADILFNNAKHFFNI